MIEIGPRLAVAEAILWAAYAWGALGLAVGAVFLAWGIDRVEPNARGAWSFRPLLLPGIVLIWPLVLWRWWVLERGRDRWQARHAPPRKAHARLWAVFAILIPAILLTGQLLRRDGPTEAPAVLIEAPE